MPEMIDVLNESGEPAGEVLSRDEIHARELWHASAYVWVVNNHDEVLLQQRSLERPTFPGKWDASAAGHITSGDTPLLTALRELEEEVGIKAAESDLTLLGTCTDMYADTQGRAHKGFAWVYLFKNEFELEDLHLQKEEVADAKIIPISRLSTELNDSVLADEYAGRNPEIYQLLIKSQK